jgi:hypothetical protein
MSKKLKNLILSFLKAAILLVTILMWSIIYKAPDRILEVERILEELQHHQSITETVGLGNQVVRDIRVSFLEGASRLKATIFQAHWRKSILRDLERAENIVGVKTAFCSGDLSGNFRFEKSGWLVLLLLLVFLGGKLEMLNMIKSKSP